jgi:hypothetical protein
MMDHLIQVDLEALVYNSIPDHKDSLGYHRNIDVRVHSIQGNFARVPLALSVLFLGFS